MAQGQITIPVRLDAAAFRRFSRFDTFRLRKRWRRPAAFALIFAAFAAAALLSRKPQSGLLAGVLLAVGLGLPLVYIGTYLSQVRAQARRLDPPRHVYTVVLDFDGIRVENAQRQESPLSLKWRDAPAAFRAKGCIYLYASAQRAFLLPDGQADAPDEAVWACIAEHMGERCRELTR